MTTASSVDAFVLAHPVEVAAPGEGAVARVLVANGEVVRTGQPLLEIARGVRRSVLRAPVPGAVAHCHVQVGDAVDPSTALLSIVRADDVLVVARFDASVAPSLARGKAASVRIPRAAAQPMPATVLCVAGAHPAESGAARPGSGVVRVVARLDSPPPAALWSGMDAVVEVECEG